MFSEPQLSRPPQRSRGRYNHPEGRNTQKTLVTTVLHPFAIIEIHLLDGANGFKRSRWKACTYILDMINIFKPSCILSSDSEDNRKSHST